MFAFIGDFGFAKSQSTNELLTNFYYFVLITGVISNILRYIKNISLTTKNVFLFDISSVGLTLFLFYRALFNAEDLPNEYHDYLVKLAVIFTFIREFSEIKLNYKQTRLNPAQLFIISFLIIIFIGTLLLLLPKATYNDISFIDALFTSTSAVCVTGLIVVDTGTYFTLLGQTIILILIQIGGLGILTFASYFSYFFKGGTTYENQLVLSAMNNSQKLSEVVSTLKLIMLITFGIEIASATFIYLSITPNILNTKSETLFFSIFHAISAFCNAGFSTLNNSLYEEGIRYNYFLQSTIIITFFLGGLGFPIVSNILNYLKYQASNILHVSERKKTYRPWVLNLNSRINLSTTLLITSIGFIAFYILEYNNTLIEHNEIGKIITALFGATTPRTAGFNTIDTSSLRFPTIMLTIVLMWIGASPQSTGGGIKTSTFAIAVLNVLSLAKGKSRIEIYRREIADLSVKRAFAIIFLSLLIIISSTICIASIETEIKLLDIVFECFSAYSTVGLSLGITNSLTETSKFILTIVMFIGRISMLSLVIAVFKKIKHQNYRYPQDEITIN